MRLIKALAALLVSMGLLAGIPALLWFFAGNPIPSWGETVAAFTGPDVGGVFLTATVLPLIGWVAWASFAIGFVLEIPNQLPARAERGSRSRPRRKVRVAGFGVQQKAAGVLIGAIIAIGAPAGAFAAEEPSTQVPAVQQVAVTAEETSQDVAEQTQVAEPVYEEREALTDRTVQPGDTLWNIAEDELGSGERFGEIAAASADVVQADGQRLTDPDLIQPGWTVKVPHVERVEVSAPASVPEESPAPAENPAPVVEAPAEESAGGAGGGAVAQEEAQSAQEEQSQSAGRASQSGAEGSVAAGEVESVDESESWGVFNVATLGGIGGVLAAGLLGLLGWRRVMQRRRRKPGQRMALPETLGELELEMRAVEDPGGQEHLDTVLRHFALWAQSSGSPVSVPPMVRIDAAEVSLYFTEGAVQLPEPFVAASEDGLVWSMTRATIPPLEDVPSAPMPALIALGRDENDGSIYVDLEQVGALNIVSEREDLRISSLSALAIELAVNSWSEDVRVLMVGSAANVPGSLGTGRIEQVEDVDTLMRNLRVQAAAAEQVLAEMGVDSPEQARLLNDDAEGWAPEVIVLTEPLEEEVMTELGELVARIPRIGIAAIANGHLAGDWTFTLEDEASAALAIPAWGVSIPVIPQLVTSAEAQQLEDIFDTATNHEATGDEAPAEISIEQIPTLAPDTDAYLTEVRATDSDVLPADDEQGSTAAETVAAEPIAETTEAVTAAADVVGLDDDELYIRVLGTPKVVGARGSLPMDEKNAKASRHAMKYGTELAALLALSDGLSSHELSAAMWPGLVTEGKKANSRRNGLVSKLRHWLGTNEEGQEYLPKKIDLYRIAARTDWDVFCDLAGEDVHQASTEQLVAALELVQGQPISGIADKRYVWADTVRQTMICKIGDVAHEVAARALESGDPRRARHAASVGLTVDPISEVHWRNAMRAEYQIGDSEGVERLITQLEDHLTSVDEGYEPDAETQALIDELHNRSTRLAA